MLNWTQIRAVVISLITSTTLLGIGTFTPNSSTNLVAVAQTKQLRPTRLTAKEMRQVIRAIPGQKPILDQTFRVNLPDC